MDNAIWILSGWTLGSLTPLGSGSAPSPGRSRPKVPSSFGQFCQETWPRLPSTVCVCEPIGELRGVVLSVPGPPCAEA
eukprot:scaffold68201_cov72-Phaeocystis_antarctica.AAC.1